MPRIDIMCGIMPFLSTMLGVIPMLGKVIFGLYRLFFDFFFNFFFKFVRRNFFDGRQRMVFSILCRRHIVIRFEAVNKISGRKEGKFFGNLRYVLF